jgi:hypothetical protein
MDFMSLNTAQFCPHAHHRTATRKRIAVPTVGNAAGFVEALGFIFDHELYLKGTRYTFKGAL